MSIDVAREEDAVQIARFSRDFIEHDLGWDYTPGKINQLIRHAAKNVVVVREAQQLVGFGIMTYHEQQANLDLLGVRLRYRYQGVGRQIVNWLEDVALVAGILTIDVQVRESNTGAIKFYKKLGYRIKAEGPGYYRGRENAILMCKQIRNSSL